MNVMKIIIIIKYLDKILVLLRDSDWHKLEERNKRNSCLDTSAGRDYSFLAGILHK